jgi:hypothetical protein
MALIEIPLLFGPPWATVTIFLLELVVMAVIGGLFCLALCLLAGPQPLLIHLIGLGILFVIWLVFSPWMSLWNLIVYVLLSALFVVILFFGIVLCVFLLEDHYSKLQDTNTPDNSTPEAPSADDVMYKKGDIVGIGEDRVVITGYNPISGNYSYRILLGYHAKQSSDEADDFVLTSVGVGEYQEYWQEFERDTCEYYGNKIELLI